MGIYAEDVLDHYRHPRNFGPLPRATHAWEEYNPLCGDRVAVRLQVAADQIRDMKWEGEGCAICLASASRLSQQIKTARSISKIRKMTGPQVLAKLKMRGLNAARVRCALLAWEAVKRALDGKTHD